MSEGNTIAINSDRIQKMVSDSAAFVESKQGSLITVDHIALEIISDPMMARILSDMGFDVEESKTELLEHLEVVHKNSPSHNGGTPKRAGTVDRIIRRAVTSKAFTSNGTELQVYDVLLELLKESRDDYFSVQLFSDQDIDVGTLQEYLNANIINGEYVSPAKPNSVAIDAQTEKQRAFLRKFGKFLDEEVGAGRIDPLIGRDAEIERMILSLSRRKKNSLIVVGDPGVGKNALIEGLAYRIHHSMVPDAIKGMVIYSLDVGAVLAGAKFKGDTEERIKQAFKLAEDIGCTVFIDEIHTIMPQMTGGQGIDIGNLLKPILNNGIVRCIGATTSEEYRKYFEKDRALSRRFQKIDLDQPSVDETIRILQGIVGQYEMAHKVTYTPEAIEAAVKLTDRYLPTRLLPDKAIDVIDLAGAAMKVAGVVDGEITADHIRVQVSSLAKMKIEDSETDTASSLSTLLDDLNSNVFGQAEATQELADAVILSKAGLKTPGKPAGVYLFTGPTGVGKTEVAKTLADKLKVRLIRYNMSEYMEKHAVAKLIGAPPGYVGFGDGGSGSGLLINDIDQNPHCVLLLDEIEKAHSELLNIFLQVFDDGTLKSSSGKEVNFQNVIIIMTSNAGAVAADKNRIGFGEVNAKDTIDESEVKKKFAPEFRNRLDAIIKFNRLSPENMNSIVDKFFAVTAKLAANQGVTLTLSNDARSYLAEKGYDPKMGARPLNRVIQNELSKPLSKSILFGPLKNGGNAVVNVTDGALTIDVA